MIKIARFVMHDKASRLPKLEKSNFVDFDAGEQAKKSVSKFVDHDARGCKEGVKVVEYHMVVKLV